MSFTLQEIIEAEVLIKSDKGSSYIRAYPEFLKYFKDIEIIDIHNFIIGAHFVYGWMPTILNLRGENDKHLQSVVDILNEVKIGVVLKEEHIINIAKVVNNSLVGTSKILHFINPKKYAIWDSRVYWFWGKDTPHFHRMQDPNAFMSYMRIPTQSGHHSEAKSATVPT